MNCPEIGVYLLLPTADYKVYVRAARCLKRTMRKMAPGALALMTHSLRCRDPRGLAEDYLDSTGWPIRSRPLRKIAPTAGRRTKSKLSGKQLGRRGPG